MNMGLIMREKIEIREIILSTFKRIEESKAPKSTLQKTAEQLSDCKKRKENGLMPLQTIKIFGSSIHLKWPDFFY